MNELFILNEDNSSSKSYGIYYTINNRFYLIYTNKDKDEKNYVIMHIAKVLKEVNNTPEGITPTGKYIGIDITDASEWEAAIININDVISNKQNNTPTNVNFLPVSEINGINIKNSRTFKLREDVVESIISKKEEVEMNNMASLEKPVDLSSTDLAVETSAEQPVVSPAAPIAESIIPPVVNNETLTDSAVQDNPIPIPPIAPNPFEMVTPSAIETNNEEQPVVSPYDAIKQQREDEMVTSLATDDMKDIVSSPVIPIDKLEENANIVPSIEPDVENTNNNASSSESFVDSIVADVSNTIDDSNPSVVTNNDAKDDKNYEQLYNDALEKTIELEKELTELHNKINNIKNIVE